MAPDPDAVQAFKAWVEAGGGTSGATGSISGRPSCWGSTCGGDLTGATVEWNSFRVRMDGSTVLTGLAGSVFGPVTLVGEDGTVAELAGAKLRHWFAGRGLRVTVLAPGGRPLGAAGAPD